MHPPFSFRLAEKKTGRARSKRKGALCQTLHRGCKVRQIRGSCETVRRASEAPSSLRRTPALEELHSRMTTATDSRGAKSHLPVLLSPRVTLYPQGVRRIRKAAELPTAAQPLHAALAGAGTCSLHDPNDRPADRHSCPGTALLCRFFPQGSSRHNGMDMHRGPPRPRLSSALGMVWTRMPASSRERLVT